MKVSTFVITLRASHAEKYWRLTGSETSWELPEQPPQRFNLPASSCVWPIERELLFERFHCAVRALASGAELSHLFDPRPQRADSFPFYRSSGTQTIYLADVKINKRLDYTKRYVYTKRLV
jgi:hypothetical protein